MAHKLTWYSLDGKITNLINYVVVNQRMAGIFLWHFLECFCLILGLIWFLKRKPKGKSILLVGLPGSGKTLIFGQLIHKKPVLTVTSVKENVGSLALDEKVFSLFFA